MQHIVAEVPCGNIKEKVPVVAKIFALVLAMMMVFAMSVTAFAAEDGDTTEATKNDSITVNNTITGESYSLYKMLDLSVDSETEPKAYTYTANSAWTAFFATDGDGASYVTIDAQGYVTAVSDAAGLAKAAAKWAKDNSIAAVQGPTEASGTSVEFTGLDDGYYLITSTLGTLAMIETTPDKSAVTVNEKNPEDSVDKKVQEDSTSEYGKENDAQVGDTVNYQVTITLVPGTRNVVFHDVMDDGLTYNGDAAIEGLTADTEYTLGKTDGDTFTITFKDNYIDGLEETTTLTLTYSATLNEKAIVVDEEGNAVIDPQTNKGTLNYGDKTSKDSTTVTTTHSFTVKKHNSDNELLADAYFQLKKSGTVLNLTKIDDWTYKVDPNGTETTFVTKDDKVITILGVDADSDYTLKETQQPAGYNLLAEEVQVTVNAENTFEADVLNQSGTELPSTGGIGTTIFYIIGAILVVGAGVVLVTRRRMNAN